MDDFDKTYARFQVYSIHGSLQDMKEVPCGLGATPENIEWLDNLQALYKEKYGEEVEYYFKNTVPYFRKKQSDGHKNEPE